MSGMDDTDFADMEKAVGALLLPIVQDPDHIGNFLVIEYDQVGALLDATDKPFITIRERGGVLDSDTFTSYTNIEVSCWGKSRQVARKAAKDSFRLLMQCEDGAEVDGVLIDGVEDMTGAEEVSLENPDDRCVTRMFQLSSRPQYQD